MNDVKLYEIPDFIKELDSMLSEAEIDEETYKDSMELILGSVETKMVNVGNYLSELNNRTEFVKSEIERLKMYKKYNEQKVERLEKLIVDIMMAGKMKKLELPNGVFSLRKSESVKIIDETAIPSEYTRATTPKPIEIKPDKKEIKKALKAGKEVEGAILETKQNLQKK